MKSSKSTGSTKSLWTKGVRIPAFSKLDEDIKADVCIVGAGISGLTTAYLLAREGRSVVVLDRGAVGSGETGRTTAHLSFALDDRYFNIAKLHGTEGAALAAESHQAAVDRIESIAKEEKINCDFARLDGYLFVPKGESEDVLDEEFQAARDAGIHDVELVQRTPLTSFETGPALRFPRQGQFHPLRYLAGLTRAITRDGGRIFTNTLAQEMEGGPKAKVKTKSGRAVYTDAVVVCTCTPVNDWVTMHTKQAAYRTYAIGLRVAPGSVPKALYWDTLDPYHYVRLQSQPRKAGAEAYDVLIVGGEDHKTGQEDPSPERFDRLEAWTRERFQAGEVEFRWSGQVLEPVDAMAFIGRNPGDEDNVYIATGDSGHGITHGTIAGILITDLIQGRENAWTKLYDPSRVSLRASKDFLRENLNVAAEYTAWLTPGDVKSVDEISPGEGAVIRRGMTKVAVYRDPGGALHERTAVCPHLGCIVAWNGVEKTWDCPCHGSRWDCEGHLLNGPALGNLSPAEEKESAQTR